MYATKGDSRKITNSFLNISVINNCDKAINNVSIHSQKNIYQEGNGSQGTLTQNHDLYECI